MTMPSERRAHARFDLKGSGSSLSRVEEPGPDFTLQPCRPVNVSFGGLCCLVKEPLAEKSIHRFLISLKGDLVGLAVVKAQVLWVHESGPSNWTVGATFTELGNGRFGPDTEEGNIASRTLWGSRSRPQQA